VIKQNKLVFCKIFLLIDNIFVIYNNIYKVAQKEALEITIDVIIQYLHNIGHSLKLYIDQFSKDTDFLVSFIYIYNFKYYFNDCIFQ